MLKNIFYKTWSTPPILLHQLLGDKAISLLKPIVDIGAIAIGKVLNALQPSENPLEQSVKLTNEIEALVGIYGEDEKIAQNMIRRRVHTCPYKSTEGSSILCKLGDHGAQKLFPILSDKITFEIKQTQAEGASFCEYIYSIK